MTYKHAIIVAGGTIASGPGPNGFEPRKEIIEDLLQKIHYDGDVVFEIMNPLIDSSWATPADWARLSETVLKYARQGYRIILAHGTDTMAFTSAALEYGLPADLDMPVIVTGSQHAPVIKGSDALPNLRRAISAANAFNHGVFIAFGKKIIGGTRPLKFSADSVAAFEAPKRGGIVGLFKKAGNTETLQHTNLNPDTFRPSGLIGHPARKAVSKVRFSPVTTLAGMAAEILTTNSAGIVVEAYGTGNVGDKGAVFHQNDDDGHEPGEIRNMVQGWLDKNHIDTFSQLFGHLDKMGKVIVITTQSPHGGVQLGHYASGAVPGAISGFNMSPDTATVKLTYALSNPSRNQDDVKRLMQTPLSGDFDLKYLKKAARPA